MPVGPWRREIRFYKTGKMGPIRVRGIWDLARKINKLIKSLPEADRVVQIVGERALPS